MDTFERSVRVAAPFERVWDFHSRIDGLEALTPDWMGLRVERVTGPDGEPDPGELFEGSTVHVSTALAGVGPRQSWTSAIVGRERFDGAGYFRDEMREGPFPEWVHTHLFYSDGADTIVRDRVRYELPGGGLGRRLGPLACVGFAPMFRYRHRRTKELLESA